MSESSTRQRIANMWNGINGVQTHYYQIPLALNDAELPGVVIFPGAAMYDTDSLGDEMDLDTRIYEMVLYLIEAAFDTEGQPQLNADPFFDSVKSYFTARPGLELDTQGAHQSESAFNAKLLGDSGLVVGPYPLAGQGSPDYVQIRWRLQVQEITQVQYKD